MRSRDAADTIGISYRQLDYLTRTVFEGAPDGTGRSLNGGSGSRRIWDPALVVRLALAWHLAEAYPGLTAGRSPFPDVAALAAKAPPPPRRGYAMVAPDPLTLTWAASWADVRRFMDEAGAALVVTYDLDDLLGDRMDLDALPGHTR